MIAVDLSSLLDEIEALLATPPVGGEAEVARVEQTLTDGYARALELEGERWRLERRIAEVVREAAHGDATGPARELMSLSSRLEDADSALGQLRAVLSSLRRHAEALRAA